MDVLIFGLFSALCLSAVGFSILACVAWILYGFHAIIEKGIHLFTHHHEEG